MKRIDKYTLHELVDKCLAKCTTQEEKNTLINFESYCNQEIKTVPRIATINTIEDYEKAIEEVDKICRVHYCNECRLDGGKPCIAIYLAEEVEVEE